MRSIMNFAFRLKSRGIKLIYHFMYNKKEYLKIGNLKIKEWC